MHQPPDRVYTTDDWYDGPRAGAADYRGAPHYYRSLYLDTPKWDPKEDRFELTALSSEALDWAVEADRLFARWDAARRAGTLPPEATEEALHPDAPLVFPEDRDRYVDLQQKLTAYLAAARARAFVVRGEFVVGSDSVVWSGPPGVRIRCACRLTYVEPAERYEHRVSRQHPVSSSQHREPVESGARRLTQGVRRQRAMT